MVSFKSGVAKLLLLVLGSMSLYASSTSHNPIDTQNCSSVDQFTSFGNDDDDDSKGRGRKTAALGVRG